MNRKIKDFRNLNIWVIGASSGIGKALSLKLINHGANLIISSRKIHLLNEIRAVSPNNVYAIEVDITDLVSIQKAMESIPKLDLVIFLAADYSPLGLKNFEVETANKIIDVNLKGAMNVTSVILPYFMKKKYGHISYVASIAGYIGLPNSSVYGATKAALINFCESIYNEAKEFNIDVSVINPGFVKTQLTDKNNFEMPFIMTPDEAANEIIKGLQAGKFDIVFPKKFSYFFRFLRILPYNLHLKLLKKLVKV